MFKKDNSRFRINHSIAALEMGQIGAFKLRLISTILTGLRAISKKRRKWYRGDDARRRNSVFRTAAIVSHVPWRNADGLLWWRTERRTTCSPFVFDIPRTMETRSCHLWWLELELRDSFREKAASTPRWSMPCTPYDHFEQLIAPYQRWRSPTNSATF